jgi:outer membrane protein, multidrug efflux system
MLSPPRTLAAVLLCSSTALGDPGAPVPGSTPTVQAAAATSAPAESPSKVNADSGAEAGSVAPLQSAAPVSGGGASASSPASAGAATDPMLEPGPSPSHVLGSWQEAVRLVRGRSTSVRTAAAQAMVATAESERALAAFYPQLQATGSVSHALIRGTAVDSSGQVRGNLPDPATGLSAAINFRQPLLDLSAWHEHHTAGLSIDASREREKDTQRLVLGSVANAVVSVFTAERLAEVSRVALRSSLSTLELTRRRAELGASSRVDVLRAQQEAALNRVQVVAANESLERARESLGLALGYVDAWGVAADVKLDALAADAAAICKPLPEITQRADVRASRFDSEVAVRRIAQTDLQLAPRLDLSSDFTYTSRELTDNGKPMQWTIGALLTVPIYDGGLRVAARHSAVAQATIATEQVTEVTRRAALEVRQAQRGVLVATENLQVSTMSRDLAKETVRLAELSFVNGKGTNFELVDAQRRYQQAELDLAVKEFEVVRARITALLAQVNCNF